MEGVAAPGTEGVMRETLGNVAIKIKSQLFIYLIFVLVSVNSNKGSRVQEVDSLPCHIDPSPSSLLHGETVLLSIALCLALSTS